MTLPLRIFEDRYKAFAEDLIGGDKPYFVTVMIEKGSEVGGGDKRSDIGCLVDLDGFQQFDDGTWELDTTARERIKVVEWLDDDPYPTALAKPWPDEDESGVSNDDIISLLGDLSALSSAAREAGSPIPDSPVHLGRGFGEVLWTIASVVPVGDLDRQRILSAPSLSDRFGVISTMINDQRELLEMLARPGDDSSR